jgi:outer membrane immunogenic protein
VGVNAGYSIGNDRETGTFTAGPPINQLLTPIADNVAVPKGVIGGAQVGYNWQGGSSWLAGLEADFQGSDQKDLVCSFLCAFQTQPGGTSTLQTTINQKVSYFGTARGRLGYTNNDVLFYLTGGGAWGRINETVTFTGGTTGATPSTSIASVSIGVDRFGWVLGGGIEGALWSGWTAKVEYLYMDLGTITSSFTGVLNSTTPAAPITGSNTSAIRDHIVRIGLNYRIGGGAAGSAMAYSRDGMQDYAADRDAMPIRSQYGMPTMYSWTGPYVGVNVGYGSGNDRTTGTLSEPTVSSTIAPAAADSVVAPKGVLGGAQVGYNWQGGANWLVGFEADLQGSNQTDKACTSPLCNTINTLGSPPQSIAFTIEQELKWFATFRARAGLVHNALLLYVTGGAALAQVTETDNFTQNAGPGVALTNASSQFTSDKAGWVVGAGAEAALSGNLTGKIEYLFMDLGNVSNSFNFTQSSTPATFSTTSTIRDHIFRAGLNYRFGGAAAPISARY